jgi:hypothetical protein
MARRIREVLADTGRGIFDLFYWNARKSVYRLRGGRCPCQNQSDDPVPGRVRCDASAPWHEPGRFRAICPLLVATAEGWRCSVAPTGVRPFWGRAFGLLGVSLLGFYFAGVIAVFAALRILNDASVGLHHVAWPGLWREIPRVQSAHLFQRAIAEFQAGHMEAAHLSLETARRRDPGNYDAGLLLAQIAMYQRSYLFADGLFTELQTGHPEHRLRTAITYHDTLLGVDRLEALAVYSLDMAQQDTARAALWMRSALLAARALSRESAAKLEHLPAVRMERIAPHARLLLRAELDLKAGRREEALRQLRAPVTVAYNPFYLSHQIERLAELGAAGDAQALLDRVGPVLGRFEHLRLQVIVAGGAGDAWGRRAAFAALLRLPLTLAQAERLAALLIAHPSAELFREFAGRVRADATLARELGDATPWVTALACGLPEEAESWRAAMGARDAGPQAIRAIDFKQRDVLRPDTALHLINTVSLPREVILALMWRTEPADPGASSVRPR